MVSGSHIKELLCKIEEAITALDDIKETKETLKKIETKIDKMNEILIKLSHDKEQGIS